MGHIHKLKALFSYYVIGHLTRSVTLAWELGIATRCIVETFPEELLTVCRSLLVDDHVGQDHDDDDDSAAELDRDRERNASLAQGMRAISPK